MNDLISRRAAIEAIVSLTAFESEDELEKFVEGTGWDDYYLGGLCDAIDEIKDTTVVDAAPVVCCNDCQHRGSNKICVKLLGGTKDSFFCAFGERRGE